MDISNTDIVILSSQKKTLVWVRLSKTTGTFLPVLLLAAFLLLSACASADPVPDPSMILIEDPKPVTFDTDMAHEDMFAALFLLAHPGVDVRAITVAGTGEAHCGPGVANALGLVAMMGRSGIPVSCGRETPLAGDHAFPADWRQGADEAYGVAIPEGGEASPLAAPDLIAETIRSSTGKISIVAVGPLTNIAEAIQKHPEIHAKIDRIYIMGGAINVPGNVGPSGAGIQNELAEWNIYIDPSAANIVLASGIPVTLVPLDATRDVPVSRAFYQALGNHSNTPAAKLVHEMLTANLDFVDSGGFQFWDSLTAAIFTDESLATFEEIELTVVEEGGPESGHTKPVPDGAKVRVATHADKDRFEKLLLTVLNWDSIP